MEEQDTEDEEDEEHEEDYSAGRHVARYRSDQDEEAVALTRPVKWHSGFPAKYSVLHDLGKGRFSVVKRCRRLRDGREMAAKFVRKARQDESLTEAEFRILRRMRHPALVRPHALYAATPKFHVFVMELVVGLPLLDWIFTREETTEAECADMLSQVVLALQYLHSHNVAYLDLKPENLLVDLVRTSEESGEGVLRTMVGMEETKSQVEAGDKPLKPVTWGVETEGEVLTRGVLRATSEIETEVVAETKPASMTMETETKPAIPEVIIEKRTTILEMATETKIMTYKAGTKPVSSQTEGGVKSLSLEVQSQKQSHLHLKRLSHLHLKKAKTTTPEEAKPLTPEKAEAKPLTPEEAKPLAPKEAKTTTPEEAKPLTPEKAEAKPLTPEEAKPLAPKEAEAKPLTPEEAQAKPLTPEKAKPLTPEEAEAKPLTPVEAKPLRPEEPEAKPLTPEKAEARPLTPEKAKPLTPEEAKAKPLTPEKEAKLLTPEEAKALTPEEREAKPLTHEKEAKPLTPEAGAKPITPEAEAKPLTPEEAKAKPLTPEEAEAKPLTPEEREAKPLTFDETEAKELVLKEVKAKPLTSVVTIVEPITPETEALVKPISLRIETKPLTEDKHLVSETKPIESSEEAKPSIPDLKTGPKPAQIDSTPTLPRVKTQAKVSSPEAKPAFRPVIRLIDLGSARRVSPPSGSSRWGLPTGPRVVSQKDPPVLAGSPEFLAPELVRRLSVGVPADYWSLGVLIYVLVSGRSPFLGVSPEATCRNILSGEVRFPVEHFASVTDEACELTRDLLVHDPAERPDLSRVLAHPWFNMKECESVLPIQSLADFSFRRSKVTTSTQEVTPHSRHFSTST
ncbi:proteoglycan 4-like [Penaeus indicus]|uniref:proteoglycan 4-like n=1 Tax=Penaeus indicus TaxID=29960 RepID=UPI00300CC865